MTFWSSLYLPCADATPVADAVKASLTALGYTFFNPFGLLPGPTYPQAIRLFVSPARDGWVRVIGLTDSRQLPALLPRTPLLALALDGASADIAVYQDGNRVALDVLAPWLRPNVALGDLNRIVSSPDLHVVTKENPAMLPLDALPSDVQALAERVDMKQAQKLFTRVTGNALKRGGTIGDTAEAARGLIAAGNPPDWDSPGGRRLSALMASLTVPTGWREPDFTTLRDAYQVAERRRLRPNATLYPGDAEALIAVPDALAYTPIYGGSR